MRSTTSLAGRTSVRVQVMFFAPRFSVQLKMDSMIILEIYLWVQSPPTLTDLFLVRYSAGSCPLHRAHQEPQRGRSRQRGKWLACILGDTRRRALISLAFRVQDKEKVLEDVRGIISQQLGTEIAKVSTQGQTPQQFLGFEPVLTR